MLHGYGQSDHSRQEMLVMCNNVLNLLCNVSVFIDDEDDDDDEDDVHSRQEMHVESFSKFKYINPNNMTK